MKKVIRLTESDLVRLVNKVIKEQNARPKQLQPVMNFNAVSLLQNNSTSLNTKLGIPKENIGPCFKYYIDRNSPSTFGVGKSEIEDYVDYLGVYGKVPGTGIPIPYQGSDLQMMLQNLQGSNKDRGIYGYVYQRTSEQDGLIYPAVELIRAFYQQEGKNLYKDLQKRLTDSDEDLEKKKNILDLLIYSYQVWLDCANGKKTDAK
jgi:hypothetical protein